MSAARGAEGPEAGFEGHFVVCGDSQLLVRVVEVLAVHFRARVVAIVPEIRSAWADDLARLPARIITAERFTADALRAASGTSAMALGLLYQDGVTNVRAALTASRAHPGLKLVVRAPNVARYLGLQGLIGTATFLSDASIASPAFVAAALGEVPPSHFRVSGRTLFVARRPDVPDAAVICGLADASSGGLLPADDSHGDIVLASHEPARVPATTAAAGVGETRPRRRRRVQQVIRRIRGVGRFVWLSLTVALVTIVVDALVLARSGGTSWSGGIWQAVLFLTGNAVWTAGYAWPANIALVTLTVAAMALMPIVTAGVVEIVIKRRLALAAGVGLFEPMDGHVVLVGLGELGSRVLSHLLDLGVSVVAIDRNESAAGVARARSRGVPIVVGDADMDDTLRMASVQTARALLTLTSDDVTNLTCSLQGRMLRPDLRVVLSMQDPELAASVAGTVGGATRNPAALAATAFAMSLTGHDMMVSIPIGAAVLSTVEVTVEEHSRLHGSPLSSCTEEGRTRVFGVRTGPGEPVQLQPADHRLSPGEILTVVGTTAGLARLIQRSQPSTRP